MIDMTKITDVELWRIRQRLANYYCRLAKRVKDVAKAIAVADGMLRARKMAEKKTNKTWLDQ